MPLDPASADACADAIASALDISDAATKSQYQKIYRQLYTSLKADILITLLPGTVVTTGSAATQTGPAAPVNMNPA
jgi:hypothetical protein